MSSKKWSLISFLPFVVFCPLYQINLILILVSSVQVSYNWNLFIDIGWVASHQTGDSKNLMVCI